MADMNKDGRAVKLRDLGVTMEARFVPQSQSRNREEKAKSLNWIITLKRGGQSLTTDYMQGIGHVPGYPHSFDRTIYGQDTRRAYEKAAEDGRYPENPKRASSTFAMRKALPSPSMDDVLYSLLLDAEAASETFEGWCANFGMDTDSRKTEAMYNACVQLGIKLRRLLGGEDVVSQLRELFEDF